MRQRLLASNDQELRVRQGQSEWVDSQTVRDKIRKLQKRGIYIRCQNIAQGPYTLAKAQQLLKAGATQGIHVRTGDRGKWIPVQRWLRALDVAHVRNELSRTIDTQVEPESQHEEPTTTRHDEELSISEREPVPSVTHPSAPASTTDPDFVFDAQLVESPTHQIESQEAFDFVEPIIEAEPAFVSQPVVEAQPIIVAQVVSQAQPFQPIKQYPQQPYPQQQQSYPQQHRRRPQQAPKDSTGLPKILSVLLAVILAIGGLALRASSRAMRHLNRQEAENQQREQSLNPQLQTGLEAKHHGEPLQIIKRLPNRPGRFQRP